MILIYGYFPFLSLSLGAVCSLPELPLSTPLYVLAWKRREYTLLLLNNNDDV